MPNRHGRGYKSNAASEYFTTTTLMQVHRIGNPPHLQQGCGGRPANAMQMHNTCKQEPPIRQDDLPTWSWTGLVLKAPRRLNHLGSLTSIKVCRDRASARTSERSQARNGARTVVDAHCMFIQHACKIKHTKNSQCRVRRAVNSSLQLA